jgi:hypothetical protein
MWKSWCTVVPMEIRKAPAPGKMSVIRTLRNIVRNIKALQVVIEFTEGCDNTRRAHLRAIERLEQELHSSVQTTLDGCFI